MKRKISIVLFVCMIISTVLLSGCSGDDPGNVTKAAAPSTFNVVPPLSADEVASLEAEESKEPIRQASTVEESSAKAEVTTADVQGTSGGISYVANKNTMKFHYPTCSSVSEMKPKNRWDTTLSRDELINMGYDPCKRCNP